MSELSDMPHMPHMSEVPTVAKPEAQPVVDLSGFALLRGESAGDAVQRLLRQRIDAALAALARGVAGVHDARKRVKECRACLRLARSAIPRARRRSLERSLSGASRGLGAARDAEVVAASFANLCRDDPPGTPGEIAAARAALSSGRRRSREAFAAAVPEVRAALDVARALAASLPRSMPWADIWSGLLRALERVRQTGSEAVQAPTDGRLHRWRRRVKDLWYQARLFTPAWPGPMAAWTRELHELADLLGDDHDLQVLSTELATSHGARLRAKAKARIVARRAKLQRKAFVLAERFACERPRDAVARVRGYVSVWRRSS